MRRVYIADTLVDGQLVLDHLVHNGIEAEMFHQNSPGGLGELAVTWPEVWIKRNSDNNQALALIDQFEQRPSPVHDLYCPQCNETNPDNFDICWQCGTPLKSGSV